MYDTFMNDLHGDLNKNNSEDQKFFQIKNTKEHLNSIGVYEGEEIIDLKGVFIKEPIKNVYELEVKIKYHYNNDIIQTQKLLVKKENLTLINNY